MKAVVLAGYGEVENLQIKELPIPQLQPEQLLVKVHATALNRVLSARRIHPIIAAIFSLSHVQEAHQFMEKIKILERLF